VLIHSVIRNLKNTQETQLDAYVGNVDGFHYAKIVGELVIDW